MEKVVAQARVYYIIGFGRDRFIYDDKKWIIGKVYLTNLRLVFKRLDKVMVIKYSSIVQIEEKDKYYRLSPPMGWSNGSILEIKHYEDSTMRHTLATLISGDFDVITKIKGIISRFAFDEERKMTEKHKKILLLLSLGIRDSIVLQYIIDSNNKLFKKIIEDLKIIGYIDENENITQEGRRVVKKVKNSI